jgi:hypothetical protein
MIILSYLSLIFRCCIGVFGSPKYEDLAVAVLSTLRTRLGKGFSGYEESLKLHNFPLERLTLFSPIIINQSSLKPKKIHRNWALILRNAKCLEIPQNPTDLN